MATAGGADRGAIRRPPGSREFVDQVLAELLESRYSPQGWVRFWGQSFRESLAQASGHTRAAVELSAGATLLWCAGHRRAATLTWTLGITHLGLLGGGDRSLGWPNRLTLLRANLPALVRRGAPLLAPLALATDYLDGALARKGGETAFGAYADGLADLTFWLWFLIENEPSTPLRLLSGALWAGPAVAVTGAYFKSGRSVDYPRSRAFRALSVGCQMLVAARAIHRSWAARRTARAPRTTSSQLATGG